jgi:hypothetical protein
MVIQPQEAFRTPNRHGQKRTTPYNIIVKVQKVQNKERIILRADRRKVQSDFYGHPIRIIDFLTKTLKAKIEWNNVLQAPKENGIPT